MSTPALASAISTMPPISPKALATSVSVMATTERKRIVSSRIAAATPISSPIGADCSSPMSIAMPRIETSAPARSAGPVTDSRRSRASGPSSSAGTSYWTVANATSPSAEACSALTPVTCGWPSTAFSVAFTPSPDTAAGSPAKTIWASAPETCGKRCSSSSWARVESTPGVR